MAFVFHRQVVYSPLVQRWHEKNLSLEILDYVSSIQAMSVADRIGFFTAVMFTVI
jgi:hypothetical protein